MLRKSRFTSLEGTEMTRTNLELNQIYQLSKSISIKLAYGGVVTLPAGYQVMLDSIQLQPVYRLSCTDLLTGDSLELWEGDLI